MKTKKCVAAHFPIFAVMFALYSPIIFSGQAWAAWSDDPTVNTPISTADFDQTSSAITGDGSGGAIIAWEDYRSGSNWDIYAQLVDASGATQWAANGVAISAASYGQRYPKITRDGSGGAIIAWQDWRNGSNWDIYAQRVAASGATQWAANSVVISAASDDQTSPKITRDGSGGAIIAWQDYRSGSNSDIYAQRVNATGVTQWAANDVVISAASNDQEIPKITGDGSGGAIIAWEDYRNNSSDLDIYVQRVNASGATQWAADGVVISAASSAQMGPRITGDGSGGAIIAWEDWRSGSHYDIYAQRISMTGTLGGTRVLPWMPLLLLGD